MSLAASVRQALVAAPEHWFNLPTAHAVAREIAGTPLARSYRHQCGSRTSLCLTPAGLTARAAAIKEQAGE